MYFNIFGLNNNLQLLNESSTFFIRLSFIWIETPFLRVNEYCGCCQKDEQSSGGSDGYCPHSSVRRNLELELVATRLVIGVG